MLTDGYELKKIDAEIYDKCLDSPVTADILNCIEEGLYPSWDAQNMNSVRLAESLGYEYEHEYIVYEVENDSRTH